MATGSQLYNTYVGDGTYATTNSKITALQSSNVDIWNSLIFNPSRHSIWAHGIEYGYSASNNVAIDSTYLSAPSSNSTTYKNNDGAGYARKFIDGVKYEVNNDVITVSYTYAYESSLSVSHTKDATAHGTGTSDGDFVRGISVNGHQISYSVNKFSTSAHDVNGDYVVTYAYINSAGVLHYNYRDLTGSDSGNFLTSFSQTADGKVSVGKGTFTYAGTSKGTTAQSHVVTDINISSAGKISYNYRDLSGTDSGNFLTSYTQTADGKISVGKGTFTYAGTSKGTTAQSHVVTDINISSAGKISYNYRDLSGTDSGNFLTSYTQTADGKISVGKGTFTYAGTNKTSRQNHVVTDINISSAGKISYNYRDLSGSDSGDFVYSYSQSTDGKISVGKGTITIGALSGGTAGKEYVKDISWSNHTLTVTRGYLDGTGGTGGTGGAGGETSITHSKTGTGGNQYFVNNISFSGEKNHTIAISYYTNPAVVCSNNSVKRVEASGSTLHFYSS